MDFTTMDDRETTRDFPATNYRETELGQQVWRLTRALTEQQDRWEALPQQAIGEPLVVGMCRLSRALDRGYRSGSRATLGEAYYEAGACAAAVEAALQDAIRHELLEQGLADRLDRELCQLRALLRFMAIETEKQAR